MKKSGGEVTGSIYPETGKHCSLGNSGSNFDSLYSSNAYINYLSIRNYANTKTASITVTDSQDIMYSSGGNGNRNNDKYGNMGLTINSYYGIRLNSSGGYIYMDASNGCISANSFAYSDEKIKSFTDDLEMDADKLIKLFDIIALKSFRYKQSNSDGLTLGFSAQDVEKAFEECDINPEKYDILDIHYNYMMSRGEDTEDAKYYIKFYTVSYNALYNLSLLRIKRMELDHQQQLSNLNERLLAVESMLNDGGNN